MPLTKAEYQRRYRKKHPERVKASLKKWRDANEEHRREYKLLTRRGISITDYNVMFFKQAGKCGICKTDNPSPNKHFSVDHDHATGAIRGLLCRNCNLVLGYAADKRSTLLAAIQYIERTS